MKKQDFILAILVVIIWGANFTVISLGLDGVSPVLLVALRYTSAALPAVFFVKPPATSFFYLVTYGLTVGVGQFSCLFYAMTIGMPAGVSSVVLQSQVFFTALFAAVLLKEPLEKNQLAGLIVSAIGLALIGEAAGTDGRSIPLGAFLLTLLAAAFCGMSNVIAKKAAKKAETEGKRLNMMSLVIWSSLVPPLPMLAATIVLEGPEAVLYAFLNLKALSVFSILYLGLGATLIGYGLWTTMIAKYQTGKVVPFALLVPVIGLLAAQMVLHEKLSWMQWLGCFVIIVGLVITNLKDFFIKEEKETGAIVCNETDRKVS